MWQFPHWRVEEAMQAMQAKHVVSQPVRSKETHTRSVSARLAPAGVEFPAPGRERAGSAVCRGRSRWPAMREMH